ncbi:MAG: hypothetical protein Q9226_007964 [Calogaya cf. arnoldii]
MSSVYSPFPPPTSRLPSPPLQAPPATPRNASHLYGEFSWPSLDISTLLEKLEDVALAEEEQLQQQQHQHFLPIAQTVGDSLITNSGEEDNSPEKQQAVFNEILMLLDEDPTRLDMEYRIHEWLDDVPEQVSEEDEEQYFTADDDVASSDDEFTDAISNVDDMTDEVDANAIPWVDDEERRYMDEMNGWFDGFGGTDAGTLNQVQKRMVMVNEREGRDRRMGCVFGA